MPPGGGPGAAAVQKSTMLTVVMVISFCETHLIPMGHFHFRYHFRDVGRVCGDQTQQAHGGFEIYIYIYIYELRNIDPFAPSSGVVSHSFWVSRRRLLHACFT